MNTDSVSSALKHFAVTLEEQADLRGWDQPATLWSVRIEDRDNLPDWIRADIHGLLEQAENSNDLSISMMFSVQLEAILEGHPAEDLVGCNVDDDVIAVMLCTEGWAYSPSVREQAEASGVPPALAPADHPDSVEVRLATVAARDGTEVTVQRMRGDAPEVTTLTLTSGRVVWGLRRVIGRPSGIELASMPAVAEICGRARNQRIFEAAQMASSISPLLADRVVEHLVTTGGPQDDEWLQSLGLLECTWEEALAIARKHAAGSDERWPADYLAWCDAGMLAAWFDSQLASTDALLEHLKRDDSDFSATTIRHLEQLLSS